MKAGDLFVSRHGTLSGFEVIEVTKSGEVVVDIDRMVRDREGRQKVDTRRRLVPAAVMPFFIREYELRDDVPRERSGRRLSKGK